MRVKMLTVECGPAGNFDPGDVREVSDEHGCRLLAGGYAAAVAPRPVEVPETAALEPQETAALTVAKRKRGR